VIKPRKIRGEGHVERIGDRRPPYRILVGRPEGKRPLGRPSSRWENIKNHLQEVGLARIGLAQNITIWRAVVNAVMNLRVP
jgi:hypothetical protein